MAGALVLSAICATVICYRMQIKANCICITSERYVVDNRRVLIATRRQRSPVSVDIYLCLVIFGREFRT